MRGIIAEKATNLKEIKCLKKVRKCYILHIHNRKDSGSVFGYML